MTSIVQLPLFAVETVAPLPASTAGHNRPLTAQIVSSAADLDGLAGEWQALEKLSGANSVFQSFAQIRIWSRHFLPAQGRRQRLHIVVVRDADRAVLILPLVIAGRVLRIAHMAGAPIAQYSDILLDPACDGHAALRVALASLAGRVDAVVLRRVRQDSHLLRLTAGSLRRATAQDAAPYADLTPYADFEGYMQSLSRALRKTLRNRHNHLDRAGGHAFELLSGGGEARRAVADALSLKRHWMVQRGAVSQAFLEPATRDCLLDLAENGAATGCIVSRLIVGGEPAAIRLGFEHGGTYFAYLSAYDPGFSELAPGKLLMEFHAAQAFGRQLQRIDMLPPVDRYKLDWCRFDTPVADHTLPLTRRGRLFAEHYQERLRPALKRTWYRLPQSLRSRAVGHFIDI